MIITWNGCGVELPIFSRYDFLRDFLLLFVEISLKQANNYNCFKYNNNKNYF